MRRGRLRRVAARRILAPLLLGALATGCLGPAGPTSSGQANAPHTTLGAQADCRPEFPDEDGWSGGDAATSVVLPGSGGRSSLWLFGDSFVERPGQPAGRAYPFIHNAVAVSHCDAQGRWRIDYAWRRATDGTPRAFFEPVRAAGEQEVYVWPIAAAARGRFVYVALLRVSPAAPTGPFQLPFRLVGVDLARLAPTAEPPERWAVRSAPLSRRTDVFPAASLVAAPDALYAFAFLAPGDGRAPRILMRLPAAALAEDRPELPATLEPALETLATDGQFRPGLAPDAARILMDDDATEMSVHFDPGLGEWLAVYADPTGGRGAPRGDSLWLRRAAALSGPWSAPMPLLRIPELADGADPAPGEPFCYAGKAHPELAPSGALLVTWVCNLYAAPEDEVGAVLERLRTTPSLYRPRARRIAIPAPENPAAR